MDQNRFAEIEVWFGTRYPRQANNVAGLDLGAFRSHRNDFGDAARVAVSEDDAGLLGASLYKYGSTFTAEGLDHFALVSDETFTP